MRVEYQPKITSAKTVYVTIDNEVKEELIKQLRVGFLTMLEMSLTDPDILDVLHQPHPTWLRSQHTKGRKRLPNSLASFMGGFLAQHESKGKDISQPQLEAIETASQMFAALIPNMESVVFVHKSALFEWPERNL